MKNIYLIIFALLLSSCSDVVINKHSITSGNYTKPNIENFDVSGVLTKPHCKGWLYKSPSRRIILTCTHVVPIVGGTVGFNDGKGGYVERKIVKVYKLNVSMFRETLLGPPTNENLLNSDTSVCVLNSAVPPDHKAYSLAHKVEDGDWVIAYHQDDTLSVAHLNTTSNSAILNRVSVDRLIKGGDSGLPWFNEKGEVISHTTLIDQGFGPHYTHPLMTPYLYHTLDEAEKFASTN
jgi:hypothetical protein